MKSAFDIMFHLGTHKTASTHLQSFLSKQGDHLIENGILYLGPKNFRTDGLKVLEVFETVQQESALAETGGYYDFDRILISEENYIGALGRENRRVMAAPLYPNVGRSLKRIARVAPDVPLHVSIATRNPATLLASMYSQQLFSGKFQTWDKFIEGVHVKKYDWVDLITRIANAGVARSITVWPYEEYQVLLPEILDHLTSSKAEYREDMSQRRVHTGLSHAAVKAVQARFQSDTDLPALIKAVRKELPLTKMDRGFQPWGPYVRKASRERYAAQLRDIAQIPGVTLLRAG